MAQNSIALLYREKLVSDALSSALNGAEFDILWSRRATGPVPQGAAVPDVVLLEAPADGSDLSREVAEARRTTGAGSVALLAIGGDDALLERARRSGADAFLTTQMSLDAFRECLRLVATGRPVFLVLNGQGSAGRDRPIEVVGDERPQLSDRESEIIGWLSEGLSNKVIARRLDITESTVKTHLKAILRKIGVANRTQAAIWAVANGMRPPA